MTTDRARDHRANMHRRCGYEHALVNVDWLIACHTEMKIDTVRAIRAECPRRYRVLWRETREALLQSQFDCGVSALGSDSDGAAPECAWFLLGPPSAGRGPGDSAPWPLRDRLQSALLVALGLLIACAVLVKMLHLEGRF